MRNHNPVTLPQDRGIVSPTRAGAELFLVSLLILFLELACIRWFPAHVLYLTFFTNTVLLACFLGMSVGCLAAGRTPSFLLWTPVLLGLAMASAHSAEYLTEHDLPRRFKPLLTFLFGEFEEMPRVQVQVGNQPQFVFFGTESS